MKKTFQKSEVLEIFSKFDNEGYEFSRVIEDLFYINVSGISWKEIAILGGNIVEIQPWDTDLIRIGINHVTDD